MPSPTAPQPANGTNPPSSSKKTMRAVLWEGKPYEMTVRDVPLPTLLHPSDAIVRLTSAAICGSDLHTYHGILGSATPPWQMGHEGAGVVVSVGADTTHFRVGDRVVIPGGANAGFFSVEKGIADQGAFYGEGPDLSGDLGGTQAEYVRVPFADHSLVRIPDAFSSDLDWLFLSDIFITGWTGLDFAGFQPGDSVAVFGAGPVGLMCAYAALLRGASRVYAIDHVRARLDKAASLGAVPIDFTSEELGSASAQILAREAERGGVDRSVDCIGQECVNARLKPQQNYVIQEAIRVTKFRGGIGLLGVYIAEGTTPGTPLGARMDSELAVSVPELWGKNLTIGSGSVGPELYKVLPKAFELVKSGRARLDWVVTSQVGIEDAPKAYERFDRKQEIKVVIRFPWEREQPVASASAAATANGEVKKTEEMVIR